MAPMRRNLGKRLVSEAMYVKDNFSNYKINLESYKLIKKRHRIKIY